ncbi:hypothetical protein MRB53_014176 [Persea americana]|uniref:Uncharacterized protein n=1 Tax=Persea americana TaxID=3435 RepID=A0ACC2KA69_PERAE|nr:hypothetical protein MRB53_014176 [Persea americana]
MSTFFLSLLSHLPIFSSLLLLLITFHIPTPTAADPLYVICDNTANYTNTSSFGTNVKLLLRSLSSNSTSNNGFYNTSVGQEPNKAYGLTLCRGDATSNACQNCIETASDVILGQCPYGSATIWYDECLLRYSNANFLGSSSSPVWIYMWNTQNATNPDQFERVLGELINNLSSRAANEPRLRMFATGRASLSSFSIVFGLVQCIRDISAAPAPSPAPTAADTPPPTPTTTNTASPSNGTSTGTWGNSSKLIPILVPTIAGAVILSIIGALLLVKRRTNSKRNKTNTAVIDGLDGSEEPVQIDFDKIRAATNDFSDENKIGQGGFGPVYKSQLMEMHIAKREKLSYIRGKTKPPAESEDGYEKWYAENQKVKRWLLMSMAPEIMKRYLRLPTAHEIWSAPSKAFYDGSDELQVFSLNQRAFTAKQCGKSLSIYYGELTEIFHELDHRDKVVMKHADDVEAYRKSIERQRVHIFLAGLDGEFEQVHGEILRKEPVPDLEECYALVRHEAARRTTLNRESENSEASAMLGRNRHTKSRCYELVGYPEWWDHNRDPRKKASGKHSTAAVVEAKTDRDDEVAERASALVATTDTMYFPSASELQGEYHQEEVQTLDYATISEPMDKNVSDLDISGVNLDESDDKHSQSPINQNKSGLDTSGVNLDESGNENSHNIDIEAEPASIAPSKSESVSPQTDTPNQSLVEDAPESVPDPPRRQNPPRSNRARRPAACVLLRCPPASLTLCQHAPLLVDLLQCLPTCFTTHRPNPISLLCACAAACKLYL